MSDMYSRELDDAVATAKSDLAKCGHDVDESLIRSAIIESMNKPKPVAHMSGHEAGQEFRAILKRLGGWQ